MQLNDTKIKVINGYCDTKNCPYFQYNGWNCSIVAKCSKLNVEIDFYDGYLAMCECEEEYIKQCQEEFKQIGEQWVFTEIGD